MCVFLWLGVGNQPLELVWFDSTRGNLSSSRCMRYSDAWHGRSRRKSRPLISRKGPWKRRAFSGFNIGIDAGVWIPAVSCRKNPTRSFMFDYVAYTWQEMYLTCQLLLWHIFYASQVLSRRQKWPRYGIRVPIRGIAHPVWPWETKAALNICGARLPVMIKE